MKVKKILKILGLFLFILLICLLIYVMRNYVIITDLQNKVVKYSNSTNYHIKEKTVDNGITTSEMNYYKKNNNQVVFMQRNFDNLKMSIYDNGVKINTFVEISDSKTAHLDCSEFEPIYIYNNLETDSKSQVFLESITAQIKSVNYNGKECYCIKGFMPSDSLTGIEAELFIDKETGLLIKMIEEETGLITEREYEFDKVEDSIFEEPDINLYSVQNDK